jgi:uncharacterized membrane protein YkvA (DUF1232 family)
MTDREIELRGPRAIERVEPTKAEVRSAWRELGRFLPAVATLLWRLARDPRVPWLGKAAAAGAVVYVVSPIDIVPDVLGGVGRIDDVWIVVRALRFLFRSAGYELMQELWPGTDEGFHALVVVAGIR